MIFTFVYVLYKFELTIIRTVTAFGGQKEEVERYKVPLQEAETTGIKKAGTKF